MAEKQSGEKVVPSPALPKRAERNNLYPDKPFKIPIYLDFLKCTGKYDLSVILNQLHYADKELTLQEIRYKCCANVNNATLRRKLNELIKLGLVEKRGNTLYQETRYRSNSSLYPFGDIVAYINTDILATEGDYLTAAIINKLRHYATAEKKTELFASAAEIKQIFQTESSLTSIRSILELLTHKRIFRKRQLVGRKYHYELNTEFLLNENTPEVLDELSAELVDLFCRYKALIGAYTTKKNREIWQSHFRFMLADDIKKYDRLRNAIAFLVRHEADSNYSRVFRTPSILKKKLSELPEISNRKANRCLWQLKHGEIKPLKQKQAEETLEKRREIDTSDWSQDKIELLHWHNANTWVDGHKNNILKGNFARSKAGVSCVDFEDYCSEARIIAAQVFSSPVITEKTSLMSAKKAQSFINSTICWKLKKYMLDSRDTIADKKGTRQGLAEGESSIPTIVYDYDIENIAATETIEEIKAKKTELVLVTANKLLSARDRDMLADRLRYGDGKRYTYEELGEKYDVSTGEVCKIIKRSTAIIKEILDPPDSG